MRHCSITKELLDVLVSRKDQSPLPTNLEKMLFWILFVQEKKGQTDNKIQTYSFYFQPL